MCAKQLYLIRHAKSSWKDSSLSDIERPLNERGKRDAPFMGDMLKRKNIFPDRIITSNARRAIETAYFISSELNFPDQKVIIEGRLYEASYKEILDIVKETANGINKLFLIGHNPGLTTLHNFLSEYFLSNIPTCGITGYEFENKWSNISPASSEMILFEYPKKYFKK